MADLQCHKPDAYSESQGNNDKRRWDSVLTCLQRILTIMELVLRILRFISLFLLPD